MITNDQTIIMSILGLAIVLFMWGRWRYDLVALFILFLSVIAGVVPANQAFSGLADPVVTTVACILVISAAISRSGFIDWIMKLLSGLVERPRSQIFLLVTLVIALSAFMNNVGALAVFIPIALAFARKARRSPSELLMPLSFGSLLGGLMTLIGTPPNIVISSIREQITGEPYQMFDFLPVGVGICVVGILYLSVGWKLIPKDRRARALPEDRFSIEDYVSEVTVPEEASVIGKTIGELEKSTEGEITIAGLIRDHYRRLIPSHRMKVQENDVLIVESDPKALKNFVSRGKLSLTGSKEIEGNALTSDEIGVVEAVVTAASEIVGLSPRSLSLRSRFGVNLLAVRQADRQSIERLSDVTLREGDVIVLQGNLDAMAETLGKLGCLPLAERNLLLGRTKPAFMPIFLMAIAVGLTIMEILPISIAFLGAVLAIGLMRILRMNEMYAAIDAPVIILLAAMIPVTQALQTTGGADLLAGWITSVTAGMSGASMLTLILVASMLVTPFLNNAAAVLLMAPIAAGIAMKLGLNVDPFLMAVAIGASCDFLTPIGHQSNTLVMGPGGYKFGDYWRMGLPLSILVVITAVPLIMLVWPLR